MYNANKNARKLTHVIYVRDLRDQNDDKPHLIPRSDRHYLHSYTTVLQKWKHVHMIFSEAQPQQPTN